MDQLRRPRQEQRGFDLARVEAVFRLLPRKPLGGSAPVEAKNPQAEFRAQVARHHVDDRTVPPVGVEEHQLAKPGGVDARAQVAQHRHQRAAETESVPGKPMCSLLLP